MLVTLHHGDHFVIPHADFPAVKFYWSQNGRDGAVLPGTSFINRWCYICVKYNDSSMRI